jgi:ubiquinone biosynthesis protein
VVAVRPRFFGEFRAWKIIRFLFVSWAEWFTVFLRRRINLSPASRTWAKNLRTRIEGLGGIWIKAAQLMALRRDLFSDEFCDEMSELQDRARGFPFDPARRVIEEELEFSLEEIFSSFDPQPIAAASLGQVHRATLRRNNMPVAVKVQRPHVADVIRRDFIILKIIVAALEAIHFMPNGRWRVMLWELHRIMRGELDYRLEASSIRRMRESLRPHGIYVPKVAGKESASRVLTMEFIDGVSLSEFLRQRNDDRKRSEAWLLENDIDLQLVGYRLYQTHTRQVFEDNLFHCDLHPGNIMLLRHSRISLIDFGSVGSIEASKMKLYYMIFQAVADHDYSKVADLFLLIAPWLPDVDIESAKADIVRVMREWEQVTPIKSLPYHEKSLGYCMQRIATVFRRYRIPIAWEFMQVNRAELSMDYSLMHMVPDIDYYALINRYEQDARMRAIGRAFSSDQILRRTIAWIGALDIPVTYAENIFFESRVLRRQARILEGSLAGGELALQVLAKICMHAATITTVLLLLTWSDLRWPTRIGAIALNITSRIFGQSATWSAPIWATLIGAVAYLAFALRRLDRGISNRQDIGVTRLS